MGISWRTRERVGGCDVNAVQFRVQRICGIDLRKLCSFSVGNVSSVCPVLCRAFLFIKFCDSVASCHVLSRQVVVPLHMSEYLLTARKTGNKRNTGLCTRWRRCKWKEDPVCQVVQCSCGLQANERQNGCTNLGLHIFLFRLHCEHLNMHCFRRWPGPNNLILAWFQAGVAV